MIVKEKISYLQEKGFLSKWASIEDADYNRHNTWLCKKCVCQILEEHLINPKVITVWKTLNQNALVFFLFGPKFKWRPNMAVWSKIAVYSSKKKGPPINWKDCSQMFCIFSQIIKLSLPINTSLSVLGLHSKNYFHFILFGRCQYLIDQF